MSFKVIGVVALARHGKDTLADALIDSGYYRLSLADELKMDVAKMFPDVPEFQVSFDEMGRLTYEVPEEDIDPKILHIRRTLWQTWGTEGRRDVFDRFWIWRWSERCISLATRGFPGVVIADIRFHNEADFVQKNCKGTIVAADRGEYRAPGVDYTHRSELEIAEIIRDKANVIVSNLGTLEEYQVAVTKAVAGFQIN